MRAGIDLHSPRHNTMCLVTSAFPGSILPHASPEESRVSGPEVTHWWPASGPQACLIWPTQSGPDAIFSKDIRQLPTNFTLKETRKEKKKGLASFEKSETSAHVSTCHWLELSHNLPLRQSMGTAACHRPHRSLCLLIRPLHSSQILAWPCSRPPDPYPGPLSQH